MDSTNPPICFISGKEAKSSDFDCRSIFQRPHAAHAEHFFTDAFRKAGKRSISKVIEKNPVVGRHLSRLS